MSLSRDGRLQVDTSTSTYLLEFGTQPPTATRLPGTSDTQTWRTATLRADHRSAELVGLGPVTADEPMVLILTGLSHHGALTIRTTTPVQRLRWLVVPSSPDDGATLTRMS
jgi:hypothetical protein